MLRIQTKTREGVDSNLKGKTIEEVYSVVDSYPESSRKAGFTVQVLETDSGQFAFFPPTEGSAELHVANTLRDVFETLEYFKNEDYISTSANE